MNKYNRTFGARDECDHRPGRCAAADMFGTPMTAVPVNGNITI